MGAYDIGDRVRLEVEFLAASQGGTYVDPDQIRILARSPGGTVATYTHGTASEVGKYAVGRYYTDITASGPGQWSYRGTGTGTNQGAEETTFAVASSVF